MSDTLEQPSQKKSLELTETILLELYAIIIREGSWYQLSPEAQAFGHELYKAKGTPLNPPPVGGMRFSMEQHEVFLDNILPDNWKRTDFWKIVIKIAWQMIATEKDPSYAHKLIEDLKQQG